MKAKERIMRYGLAAYLRSCRKITRPTKQLIQKYKSKYGDIPITREQAIQKEVERRLAIERERYEKEREKLLRELRMYKARIYIKENWKSGIRPTEEELEEAGYK